MPIDAAIRTSIANGLTPIVRRFNHAELLGGNQTIAGGVGFQGLTLELQGFQSFELWLFMSANNAGTSIAPFLAAVDPDSDPTLLSSNTGQMSPFAPGPVTPGLVNIWKRFGLDPVAATQAFVPLRCALWLQNGGFASNLTISNSKLFASQVY